MRHAALFVTVTLCHAAASFAGDLDALLGDIEPTIGKWATVVVVDDPPPASTAEPDDTAAPPSFRWRHYGDSADSVGFWPASTIKVYTVVAAVELLNELQMPLDSALIFERRTDGRWVQDAARTMREMVSEVFRRSSNEDYTLLLRFVGIDRMNRTFLVPGRGFERSALMRGYVLGRPYEYVRSEPQRITVRAADGREKRVEHTWSGESYSKQRGATVISAETGNCATTRDLAECLRRIMFHERLPAEQRFNLTDEQIRFIREGSDGLTGLLNKAAGPYAWTDAAGKVFPNAKFYHKGGWIRGYSLDAAYVDDADSSKRYIVVVATATGDAKVASAMARRIAEALRDGKL